VGRDDGIIQPVALTALGQRYRRYRLADPPAEAAMGGSLRRWGQLSPVVACVQGEQLELLDGFKRWAAAQQVSGWTTLSVRVVDVDERTAKAAILGLNRGQRPVRELEEAWIVQALVRDDGLTQVEAAHLLGQHQSWVCRRLALLEKLSAAVKEDLRLGLLGPALARQLVRLPAGNEHVGNQQAVLALVRRETLTAQEVSGVVELLQGASPEQAAFVLDKPREALAQARGMPTALRDPRLRRAGNWLARHLTGALEALVRMENWLRTPGERELTERDRQIVQPLLARLGDHADAVAEQVLGPVRGVPRGLPRCGAYGRSHASCDRAAPPSRGVDAVHRQGPGHLTRRGGPRAGVRAGAAPRASRALARAAPPAASEHHRCFRAGSPGVARHVPELDR
jgi:ParB-like chromosome segregation protein Spo0J